MPHISRAWKRSVIPALLLILPASSAEGQRRGRSSTRDYSWYVRKFADTLLEKGLDVYGPQKTPLWAGVIDSRDFSVPREGVPATPGVRESDRAVGGCNLYHDAVTLRVFRVLSALSGEPKYASAARDYMDHYLEHVRSEKTGFLAWGEHLYYDFFRDQVATERKWHELLEWTPPWRDLWEVNPQAVTAAIEALRYHYYDDDPAALFNRHAFFDIAEHQKPGGQPWIKHSGLYAYSFMFLHRRTGDRKWLAWARGAAELYWQRRNPETNLTLSCIDDPREGSKRASSGQALLAYWLLKAYQLNPRETQIWRRAVALLEAFDKYAYDAERKAYRASLDLDGTPGGDGLIEPWNFAYGAPSILPVGRIAAYFARTEKSPVFVEIARRIADMAKAQPPPDDVSVEGLGFALNLNLDLYELTDEQTYLTEAKSYADTTVEKFWAANSDGGLFVRRAGDPYYEAKAGVGEVLAGLLRLHIDTSQYAHDPKLYDWSF